MSALVIRDCNWCGARVPHAAGRGGGPVAHVRAGSASVVLPCARRRATTAEERSARFAELVEMGLETT